MGQDLQNEHSAKGCTWQDSLSFTVFPVQSKQFCFRVLLSNCNNKLNN
jgi:hypothetical protein